MADNYTSKDKARDCFIAIQLARRVYHDNNNHDIKFYTIKTSEGKKKKVYIK